MSEKQKIIFVVDDSNTNLVACKEVLKSSYVVYPIPSAVKMFNILEHVNPDLILLDVEMPEMDGYEAAQKLKAHDTFKKIPIIFLSAKTDSTSESEGLNLGAVDYIHKPIVSTELLGRIEKHLK